MYFHSVSFVIAPTVLFEACMHWCCVLYLFCVGPYFLLLHALVLRVILVVCWAVFPFAVFRLRLFVLFELRYLCVFNV